MRFRIVAVALLAAAASGQTRVAGPIVVERELWRLEQQVARQRTAGAWDDVRQTIRRMAALDAEHPKVYVQVIELQRQLGRLQDAPALMQDLGGAPDGPGRIYGDALQRAWTQAGGAAPRFARALEAYRGAEHLAGQAAALTALGLLARNAKRYDEATERYRAAQSLLERLEDRDGQAQVLENLAQIEMLRNRPDAALEMQRRALGMRERIGDAEGQANTWIGIAQSHFRAGRHEQAFDAFRRAAAIRRATNNRPGEISVHGLLSAAHAELGDWEAAVAERRRALELAADYPDPAVRADLTVRLGDTLLDAGKVGEAVRMLESAVELQRELDRPRHEADARIRQGSALNRSGEPRRARGVLERALRISREADDASLEARARTALGNAELASGDLTSALLHHGRALELYRARRRRAGEQSSLNNLGAIHFQLGDQERARRYIEQGRQLAEERGDEAAAALARHNLGAILAEEGRLDEALRQTREAIRRRSALEDRRGTAFSRANAAEILLRLGRLESARRELEPALVTFRDVEDRAGEAFATNLLGELEVARGEPGRALDSHGRALRLADEAGLTEELWRAHAGLGDALLARGRRAAATEEILRAIELVEGVRATLRTGEFGMRYLAGRIGLYETALDALLPAGTAAGPPLAARTFGLVERARARGLLDLLAESRSALVGRLSPEMRRREERLLDRLSAATVALAAAPDRDARDAAGRELAAVEEQLGLFEAELRVEAPGYGAILYPRPCSSDEVRETVLRDGETVLAYYVGERRAWLWVVAREGVSVHALPPPAEIAGRVDAFLAEAESPSAALGGGRPDLEAAERLTAAVLPPGVLPTAGRLLVAPDGPLHHVPFAALRVAGDFLVERYEIVVIPSATTLRLMRERPTAVARDGFLGVGDPVSRPEDDRFPRLRFSRREVLSIAEMFPSGTGDVLSGPAATKSGLLALDLERYRFVHFATHGWLDAEQPRLSGLRLSPPPSGRADDLLSRDEILELRLAAESVVLSACRSGLGELLEGEGLVGLTRAFLYAGSRTVVVSMWNVGDRSTTELMRDLYEGLQRNESVAAALRRAQRNFLDSDRPDRRRIARWAPFVIVGAPGPTVKKLNRAVRSADDERDR